MITVCIQGGKKNKMRPGDILGALGSSKKIIIPKGNSSRFV